MENDNDNIPTEAELRKQLNITPEQRQAKKKRDLQKKVDDKAKEAVEQIKREIDAKKGFVRGPIAGMATGQPPKDSGVYAGARCGALKMSKVAAKSIKDIAKEDIDKADTIEREESVIDKEGETRDDE